LEIAEELNMNVNQDLVGKTITGVIASTEQRTAVREIWMLQFSDGTHVEFVSPRARKALRKSASRPSLAGHAAPSEAAQLSLNVA
jgi:hypothetical protein